jgi:hypothetical protein
MSFKAVFKVDGKDYNVLSCNFRMHQDVDVTGRPSSIARGGIVNLVVESTDNSGLLQWMCDSYMKKDATITFNKREENSKLKELEIKEAYCVGYEESFDSAGSGAMTESITLSAKSVKMGDGEHLNEWPI